MTDKVIKFTDDVDVSQADVADRAYCRAIIKGIYQFENPMPKLKSDLYATPDHYNISVKGWNQTLNVANLYDTFLSKNKSQLYDPVLSVSIEPTNDEGEPVVLFRVRKSSFGKIKKRSWVKSVSSRASDAEIDTQNVAHLSFCKTANLA